MGVQVVDCPKGRQQLKSSLWPTDQATLCYEAVVHRERPPPVLPCTHRKAVPSGRLALPEQSHFPNSYRDASWTSQALRGGAPSTVSRRHSFCFKKKDRLPWWSSGLESTL